jgi:hypothetical protein
VILVPLSGSWATADDVGVPVEELVTAVKNAIKTANVSVTDTDRDLAVTSVYLRLNTVLTLTAGGSLDFRVPFIGMKVKIGGSVTRHNTHAMGMTLIPEDEAAVIETRDAPVEAILVEAIETVRAVMTHAAGGDDPFTLQDSAVELTFGVASNGTISLGIDGDLNDEVTHTMRLTIAKPGRSVRPLARCGRHTFPSSWAGHDLVPGPGPLVVGGQLPAAPGAELGY